MEILVDKMKVMIVIEIGVEEVEEKIEIEEVKIEMVCKIVNKEWNERNGEEKDIEEVIVDM